MGQNIEIASLRTIIDDLQRRVYALEHAPRLTSASLHRGTLTILDDDKDPLARLGVLPDNRVAQAFYNPDGNELIRLGELPDGKVGLAVYDADGNEQVRFGQLAGGGYGAEMNLVVESDPWTITRNTTGFGDGTAVLEVGGSLNVGPTVTIETGSRALVWTSVFVQCAAANLFGRMSYAISGSTTSAASDEVARFAILESGTGGSAYARVGSVHLQMLNPGINTFTCQYNSGGSTAVSFGYRTIAVLPI